MKLWAWFWLGGLALLGWAPSLALSYSVAFALAVGHRWNGPAAFGAVYCGILAVSLFMVGQVRKYFGLQGAERAWFTYVGSGGLLLVWAVAYWGFRLWAGS